MTPTARSDLRATLRLLGAVLVFGLLLRSLAFGLLAIPNGSMLPQLQVGDTLLVAKWPYGWSRYSLIGSPNLFSGRVSGVLPDRGDMVVFRAPSGTRDDVKRVIGLPGDRVAIRDGAVRLNGRPLSRLRIGDLVVPRDAAGACPDREGPSSCRFERYTETLPDGRAYPVLDSGPIPRDDRPEVTVPAGHLFLIGDGRDLSADSRLPVAEGGVGMVPVDALIGRALVIIWSTDGSARWADPRTWRAATRWDRIGQRADAALSARSTPRPPLG